MSWTTRTLGDIAIEADGEIRTGPFGSQLHKHDYVEAETATPVVMPKDMVEGRIDTSSIARIDEVTRERLSAHILRPGDIVLGRRGEIGRRAWVSDYESGWLCGTGSMRISIRDSQEILPRYLYYFLELPSTVGWLQGHSVGATMSNLSAGVVQQLPVVYPSADVQQTIVGTLDTLETLIENNRRRIEILEETARLLYREWFVRFRFPGNGVVALVDSELGLIPEGWEVLQVGEALETVGGGTPSKQVEDYWLDGEIRWFTPTDLTRAQSVFAFESGSKITESGLKRSSAKLFPADSVMMTSRATIGVVSIATSVASTNQGFITCVPSERMASSYIYFWLRENVDLFLSLAGGATFKELRKSTFRELPILVPPGKQMDEFEEHVGPMMALIKNLLRQNEVLRTARDLLLPRLVSGKLDISELEAVGV
ncbi:MAG: restriction endonuclease subunit S [Acidimicrobiales bacterium]|nr:restriction endonuclease subunit S [Acidimicrobiales bacterium]MYG87038.1 restriction endonuclease subunit S [Acidimicrobiales bacterium]MYI27000.1 restriction endonuclease subunit S [Acidimicrobiales bacterium]